MPATSYGKLSEMIITEYAKKYKADNSVWTLRHVAEMVAQEVAFFAKLDAFEQDKLGEATFANDQFITTYNNIAMQTDANGNKYIPLPNAPAGMPQGREINYVGFVGNKKTQAYPMRNKDRFMQSIQNTPNWMILYYVENGNIVFENLGLVAANVNLSLVGAVPSGNSLLDLPLNCPKSTETMILDKILNRLNTERNILPDQTNNNIGR